MTLPRLRRWGLWAVSLAAGAAAAALLVAASGVVNIAVTAGHPVWLEKFLGLAMRRSIEFHSSGVQRPVLDQQLLPLGAAHFHGNCAICHGAPGQAVNPTFAAMLPQPPPLQQEAKHWRTRELYWIGFHGLQFTGMPRWSGDGRADEMWAIALLLRELPEMDVTAYRRLAYGNSQFERPTAEHLAEQGANVFPINTCSRCHGTATAPAISHHVPRLGGQSRDYLLRALMEYHSDRRQSGFMEPVAATLDAGQVADLAGYYATLAEPARAGAVVAEADVTLGRRIAEQGDPQHLVPPCLSCHGSNGRGDFPRLAGQHALYIEQQLRVWQSGGRSQTAYGIIMAQIAKRLSQEQIRAVAAYFASLAPASGLVAPAGGAP